MKKILFYIQKIHLSIKDKRRTYQSLIDLFGDLEIILFTKQELVAWKSTQLMQDI